MGRNPSPPSVRFWNNVDKSTNCWLWLGYIDKYGYGMFSVENRPIRVHRFSYELHYGKIDSGKDVHHKCEFTACVNPDHLELLTRSENSILRNGGMLE